MSGKVLTAIAQALTPEVIDAMADRAKMDRASARKAAELGVPAILTALTEIIVKTSGVARLTRALAGRSTSSGQVQDDHGDGIRFLLGDEDADALASTIGRVVGAPEASAYAFLDELTCTILRTLAGASEKANAGGNAVANLLTAEKELIAASMPAGLSSLLCANFSSSRLATGLANIGKQGSLRGGNERPPMGAATAPSGRPRAQMSRAYLAVVLAALAAVAWYMLAASIKQAGGAGSDVVISSLPEPNARSQAQADVAALDAGGQYQKADIFNRAGKSMGSVTDVLGGVDQIALALASLGRWLGLGEAGSAAPAAQVRRGQNGGNGHLVLDGGEGRGRQPLLFVSPEFTDAIRPPQTTAVDRPAGPTIASH
jgi:hypothetical protein